ncbi:MAG: hypothetical protein AB1403_11185 [Candidatus Riflebacteria bacterium]
MNLTATREKTKKIETSVLLLTLLVGLANFLVYLRLDRFFPGFIIGYLTGAFGFIMLSLTFSYIDRLPPGFRLIAILSTCFKILFLFVLALILKLIGISVIEFVVGLMASQLIVIVALIAVVFYTRKKVEVSDRSKD